MTLQEVEGSTILVIGSCLWYRHTGSSRGQTLAPGESALSNELKYFNPTTIMDNGKSPPQKGNGKVPKQNNTGKKRKSRSQEISGDNTVSKSSNMSNNKKRKSPSQTKISKNHAKKNKPHVYPMGLSNKDVSPFNPPKCPYCCTKIKVGEWHAIKKINVKIWKTEMHYHFSCASEALSQEEKK
jgi:hypothetical protein